jgi:hypothetical protein
MKKILIILLLALPSMAFAQQYAGTNFRGQMVTYNPYGQQVALVSAKVDLYWFNPSIGQLQYLGTSYTDAYGFFWFRLVPPNDYVIYVNNVKNYNIRVIPIDYRFYQFQDLGTFFY